MRIAIVGAGISGLGAAWALAARHEVTIYESGRIGGHANTVDIAVNGSPVPVDTGFIVYNERNYPNLVRLFAALDVPTAPSDMSFAVSARDGALEYSGSGLGGLLAQPANLARPRFLRMMADVPRFYQAARRHLAEGDSDLSFGGFLDRGGYSAGFVEDHILPMAAAIWSGPTARMRDFPMTSMARFLDNHGLLQFTDRPPWRTVIGGSRTYVQALLGRLPAGTLAETGAVRVSRGETGVDILGQDGATRSYDHAVLACHGDQALHLLADPDAEETSLLGCFRTQPNRAWLHGDTSLMPRRRAVWSSWNVLAGRDAEAPVVLSYWMNRLQPLGTERPVIVTLNPTTEPAAGLVHGVFDYRHPLFDRAAMKAQGQIGRIQGRRRTWFAGAWLGYGFHEDGLRSGLAVSKALDAPFPWSDEIAAAA